MARDIEEFLRRAAERRKQAQQGGGQKRPPAQRPPAQRNPPRKPPPRLTITENDIVESRKSVSSNKLPSAEKESVSDHVRRYLDTSDIAEHVEHLGDEIEQADERMEAHLDDVFDHDVGKLSARKRKSVTDQKLPVMGEDNKVAKSILKLLQNPKTVRQSILVAEILKRPDFDDEE